MKKSSFLSLFVSLVMVVGLMPSLAYAGGTCVAGGTPSASAQGILSAQGNASKPVLIIGNVPTGKVSLKVCSKYKLGAKASSGKVSYKSSNARVAGISKKGVVKAKRAGKATLTVTAKSGASKVSKKVKVTVLKAPRYKIVKRIKATASANTLQIGGVAKVAVGFSPAKASNKNVRFSSSNPAVVSVKASGAVKGVSAGTARVKVVSCANAKAKASVKITVVAAAGDGSGAETGSGGGTGGGSADDGGGSGGDNGGNGGSGGNAGDEGGGNAGGGADGGESGGGSSGSDPSPADPEPSVEVRSSLEEYSWAELKQISNLIATTTWTRDQSLEVARKYNLVDSDWKLSPTATKSVTLTDGTSAKIRIMGFRHDNLESGGKSGSDGKSGITFEFADVPKKHRMHSQKAAVWESCEMRGWLNSTFFSLLPADLSEQIVPVIKMTDNKLGSYNGNASTYLKEEDAKSSVVTSTIDSLWLPSHVELAGYSTSGRKAVFNAEGMQYQLYSDNGIADGSSGFVDGLFKGASTWCRTPCFASMGTGFFAVYKNFSNSEKAYLKGGYDSTTERGASPGFCL